MKAVRIHAFGGSDQVRVDEIPTPEVKKDEALIRIHAAAVNPVDWMIREKIYNPHGADQVPLTLGQDFSGIIEQIDPGSETSFRPGDEVFGEVWGSFAEFAVVPLSDLVLKPKSLDFVTAASIPMPALTAWQMVIHTAQAGPKKKFLIHGANGGVGAFAVQFAKWKGSKVIATASKSSFKFLKSIGVDQLIDYHEEKFEDEVESVDVVIDPIGSEIQARSWNLLKSGGQLINLIGEIDQIAAKKKQVNGIKFSMEYRPDDLREIAGLMDQGVIKPHISKIMPLEQARAALDMNQQGRSHGKIVLKVA